MHEPLLYESKNESLNEASPRIARQRLRVRTYSIVGCFGAVKATGGLAQAFIQCHKLEVFGLQQLDDLLGKWYDARVGSALRTGAKVRSGIPHVVVEGHERRRACRGGTNLLYKLVQHVGDLRLWRVAVHGRVPVNRVEVPAHDGATRVLTVAHALQHTQAVGVIIAVRWAEARGNNTQDRSEGVVEASHLVGNVVLVDRDDVSVTPGVAADLMAGVVSSLDNAR